MNYNLEASYFAYNQKVLEQERELNNFIQEALAITEGVNAFGTIKAINEAESGTFRSAWEKVKAFMIKLWNKFVEAGMRLVAADAAYLVKYKDIILKKELKDATFTMPHHEIGIRNMINLQIPMFSPALMDMISTGDGDQNTAIKKKFVPAYNGNTDFQDFCLDYFKGGEEKDFSNHALNMTDIYNYCKDYKDKIVKTIEKDKTNILQAQDNVIKLIETKINETNAAANNQQQQQPAAGQTVQHNSVIYSKFLQSYVTEDTPPNNQGQRKMPGTLPADRQQQAQQQGGTPQNQQQDNTASKSTTVKIEDKAKNVAGNMNTTTTGSAKVDDNGKVNADVETLKKKAEIFKDICRIVLTTKMTASENIYKNYMAIIKKHVSDYISDTKNASDVSQKASSTYGKENQQKTTQETDNPQPKEEPPKQ